MKKLFSSKFINNANSYLNKKDTDKQAISDIATSGSLFPETNHPLRSSQQLNIDYSKFENHTFFHSAVVKINEAFENISNNYPFDGTVNDVEKFEESLTGFERHVLDNYPKNKGYLIFSGTQKSESITNGTYISIQDNAGLEFPTLSKETKNYGKKLLDPKNKSFSIQFFIDVPEKANDNQIIFQKRNSLSSHTTVYLSSSSDTEKCDIGMSIASGTYYLNVTSSIDKGDFKHVSLVYDKALGESKIIIFNTGSKIENSIVSSSNRFEFDSLDYNGANIEIGQGTQFRIDANNIFNPQESLSGSIDELRFFHAEKKLGDIKKEKDKTIYKTDSLKLHLKFNEPYGDYNNNDVVFDSSGNNFSSKIKNFNYLVNRATGSFIPVMSEHLGRSIVLQSSFSPIDTFYNNLIVTGTLYDNHNPNIITKLIPGHYLDVGNVYENFSGNFSKINNTFQNLKNINSKKDQSNLSVQNLLKFLFVWAKYFDDLKIFVDNFSLINHVLYNEKDTVPDIFLQKSAKKLGISLPYLFETANAEQFLSGFDTGTSPKQAVNTLYFIQNSIWRRILSDAAFFKKTRGTLDSVKAVFRNSGIEPDNVFNIREYGGSKIKSLEGSVSVKKEVFKFVNMSGSISNQNGSVDSLGKNQYSPYLQSSFLSSSRIEVGKPLPQGTFIDKDLFSPHGISNNKSDGLLTSGSFTYQANYLIRNSANNELSLARIHTTGSTAPSSTESCILNFYSNKDDQTLTLSINDSPSINQSIDLVLTGVNLYDDDIWSLSFGREASELLSTSQTGSIFIRAAKYSAGEKISSHYTSSYFKEHSDSIFSNVTTSHNVSGTFIMIGSQSFQDTSLFLNSEASKKQTYFSEKVNNINFWSYALKEKEFEVYAKNPNSVGTLNPFQNYNFNTQKTGSFERIRLQTVYDQYTTASDGSGDIRLFDMSKNNLHISGKSFEANKTIFSPEYALFEQLSSNFDINSAKTKVRVRSLQNEDLLSSHKYAQIAPVNRVDPAEEVFDDTRFSIDFPVMKGLNENIMTIFADFSALDDALGRPNLLFSTVYPDLIELRKIYFENVLSQINLSRYREVFKWIDTTFTDIVYELLPRNTNFLGINLVYESHVLERSKISYLYDEIYLKSLPRDATRGNLFLSQFSGRIKKS